MDAPTINTLLTNLPFDDYRAAQGINASGLKTLMRSPAHFKYERDVAQRKETPAMRMGTLIHAAILEPFRFAETMVLKPAFDMRTKAGKLGHESFHQDIAPGKIVVSQAELDTLTGILASVKAHKRLCRLLEVGKREVSLFWQDPINDVLCKSRMDFLSEQGILVDIKSTTDARYDAFSKSSVQLNYALSAAHYLEGLRMTGLGNPDQFVMVAIEKDPPYCIAMYRLVPEELSRGHAWRHMLMEQYAQCVKQDVWPGYSPKIQDLDAPAWAPKALDVQNNPFDA